MYRDYKIYAVDFDGTLCREKYPDIGDANTALINYLINQKKRGSKIILWTCRTGELLQKAVELCRQHGLEFDAVNDNLPEIIEFYGVNSRKVYADYYIDDLSLPAEVTEW